MPRPSITWITSDWHLYHDAIVEACNRPPDYQAQILKHAKTLIAQQDTTINLGDVIFYNYPKLHEFTSQIKGKQVLVMGNHDRKSRGWYERQGFAYAADMLVLDDIVFSHKPLEIFPSGVNFNVHGHYHVLEREKYPKWWSDKSHYLISLERLKYKPVKLDEIIATRRNVNVP